MTTHFSQLIYTSTPESGFKLLTSGQVPSAVEQIFIEQVVHQHWNAYDPPDAGYRAVYLHQVDALHTLFGWVYDDGTDEFGRGHIPYFVCYHLVGALNAVQLESIFMCLHKGPVAVPTRQHLPVKLDLVNAPDLWSYQPARPGVRVGVLQRQQGHAALEQGQLIDLLIAHEQPLPAVVGSSQSGAVRPALLAPLPELHPSKRPATILDDGALERSRGRLLLIALVVLLLPFGLAALFSFHTRQTQQKLEVVNQKVTPAEATLEAVDRNGVRKIEKVEQRVGQTEQQLGPVVRRLDRTEDRLQKVDRTDRRLQAVAQQLSRTENRLNTPERSTGGKRAKVITSKWGTRVPSGKNRIASTRWARTSATRKQSLTGRRPAVFSRSQDSPELVQELSPSLGLARYTSLKEQQAKSDATRMFGLYRKNRKS